MATIFIVEAQLPDGTWQVRMRTTSQRVANKKLWELRRRSRDPQGKDIRLTTQPPA